MLTIRKNKLIVMFIFFSVIALGFVVQSKAVASGEKETEDTLKRPFIGIVHVTFAPTFFFQNVQYQSFYEDYHQSWEKLADQYDFDHVEIEGGLDPGSVSTAVRVLIDKGVDAILLYQHEPTSSRNAIEEAQKAGVPIAVHGIRPFEDMRVPYIGFDEYATCFELGKNTALYFQNQFPNEKPVVLVNNSRTVTSDIERESGFIDGFQEIFPDATVINKPEDNGVVENVMDKVQAALLQNPEINVIFNTSDARALGTMLALERLGNRKPNDVLVASVGGSEFAMKELLKPESAWKAEVGLSVNDSAEKSYEILVKMIQGEIPVDSNEEFLIGSKVFVDPQLEEVQDYLRENLGIEDFNLQ